jgi:hypothetical protein
MRTVTLLKHYVPEGYNGGELRIKYFGSGIFLAWGVDYEELQNGVGMFSTAIIEMPDGTVKNWPVDMIRFEDKQA